MNAEKSTSRVGVYIDTSNIYRSGGNRMRYDVLRDFARRDGAELARLNAYVSMDVERLDRDPIYARGVTRFHSVLRDMGYKVIVKEVQWYKDESGERYGKADADLDLAVDMLLQSENLDRILLVTGDGDFARLVQAVQNRGCRVEVVAFDNVSQDLRREADMFLSGYLIPDLLPTNGNPDAPGWGQPGSRVRGVCYFHKNDYGFMRFLTGLSSELWLTDTKDPRSPYRAAYFHDSSLPRSIDPGSLPSYNLVFEFDLFESDVKEGNLSAGNLQVIARMPA
jgi:uncharacterized LabA/DUF88 family protein